MFTIRCQTDTHKHVLVINNQTVLRIRIITEMEANAIYGVYRSKQVYDRNITGIDGVNQHRYFTILTVLTHK